MDDRCLDHRLTAEERVRFEADGFLIVPDVLDEAAVARLEPIVDGIDARYRQQHALAAHKRVSIIDVIGSDPEMLELLDHPKTIAKVIDILGWHIQLYHSHVVVTPPLPLGYERGEPRLRWHQDTARFEPYSRRHL